MAKRKVDSILEIPLEVFNKAQEAGKESILELIGEEEYLVVTNEENSQRYQIIRENAEKVFTESQNYSDPCIVISQINIKNITIDNPVICESFIFINDVYLTDITFNNNADFSKSTFYGDADFRNSTFKENCDFRFNRLLKSIDITYTSFRAEVFIKFLLQIKNKNDESPLILYDNDKADIKRTRDNYHSLKKAFHKMEQYEEEDLAYYRYRVCVRKCRKLNDPLRLLSFWLLDIGSKYFTSPLRVLLMMLVVLLGSFSFYSSQSDSLGHLYISNPEDQTFITTNVDGVMTTTSDYQSTIPLKQRCMTDGEFDRWEYVKYNAYFSIITFTTIGYGDIQPSGWLRFIAGLEGFTGVLLMSLFLITAAKKVLW